MRNAFTQIELVVALALLALLGGIGAVSYDHVISNGEETTAFSIASGIVDTASQVTVAEHSPDLATAIASTTYPGATITELNPSTFQLTVTATGAQACITTTATDAGTTATASQGAC